MTSIKTSKPIDLMCQQRILIPCFQQPDSISQQTQHLEGFLPAPDWMKQLMMFSESNAVFLSQFFLFLIQLIDDFTQFFDG